MHTISLTTGKGNVGVGTSCLSACTTGSDNVGLGNLALLANTAGGGNFGLGSNALRTNTTGNNNVGVGESALYNNTTASGSVAVGRNAGTANSTGGNNVAVGLNALRSNTAGNSNVAIGAFSGDGCNTTGGGESRNVFIGYNTGLGITSGVKNSIIGANVTGLANPSNNIVIADGDGNQRITVDASGNPAVDGPLRAKSYTVATVPAAATAGAGAPWFMSPTRHPVRAPTGRMAPIGGMRPASC